MNNADIQKALEPVILYRINAEKGEGKDLAKEFKIRAYPTFILSDKDGKAIDLWLGYEKNSFVKTLADARTDLSTIDEKKASYATKPMLGSAVVLGRYSSAMGDYKEAVEYYKTANALTGVADEYLYNIFENTAYGARKDIFTYDDAARAAEAVISSPKKDPWEIIQTGYMMISLAKSANKPGDVAKYLQAGLDATATTENPDLKKAHSDLMVEFAMTVKGDTASALEYKKASLPKDWENDPSALNEFAWWCLENKTNLNEAEKLSEKSVKLAKPGREKANNLDTLAEIKFAKGNIKEALEIEKKAVNESPSTAEFSEKVERFQKALSEKK